MENIKELHDVLSHFVIHGDITSIERVNKGYINSTYRVKTLSKNNHVHQYVLQRINTNVFHNIDALMNNYVITTEHLNDNLEMPGKHVRGTVQLLLGYRLRE